jgi:hypothetical protein
VSELDPRLERLREAYFQMAEIARYRPQAPEDARGCHCQPGRHFRRHRAMARLASSNMEMDWLRIINRDLTTCNQPKNRRPQWRTIRFR